MTAWRSEGQNIDRQTRRDENGSTLPLSVLLHCFSPEAPISILSIPPSPSNIPVQLLIPRMKMILLSVILPVLSFLPCLVASSSSLSHSVDVLYWPVTSSQPSTFARISYDPTSLNSQVESVSPPKDGVEDLIRIGLYTSSSTGSKQWSGTLTSLDSLLHTPDHQPTLRLHLGPSGDIYHVSLSLYSSSTNSTDAPNVVLVPNEQGPRPQLNRPIVVRPDGETTEEVPEKNVFQK